MNTWEMMKNRVALDCGRPRGSVGYMADLQRAASIFCDIRHKLKDEDEATRSFNEDTEVTTALTSMARLSGVL